MNKTMRAARKLLRCDCLDEKVNTRRLARLALKLAEELSEKGGIMSDVEEMDMRVEPNWEQEVRRLREQVAAMRAENERLQRALTALVLGAQRRAENERLQRAPEVLKVKKEHK